MNYRVDSLVAFLQKTISGWPSVECIAVDPRAEINDLDPYFALVIDVYHRGAIPSASIRRSAFGDPGAFETAASGTKDRFFLDELPIRIEYKEIEALERLLERPTQNLKILKNSGTYTFYRLETNRILFDATGWGQRTRAKLGDFPEEAWLALGDSFRSKMEHYLADMGAASLSGDKYFLLLSEAGFLRYAAAAVFMANRKFEPSHREIESLLKTLPLVPEGFWAAWDVILQKERQMPAPKRFEVARLLASSVYSLSET